MRAISTIAGRLTTADRGGLMVLQGRIGERRRHVNPDLLHERREVSRPSHRHGGSAEQVLEDQVPPDNPGDEFTERRIPIGVGAAGDRYHARELGVAQTREKASKSGHNKREDDRGPRVLRRRGSGQYENTRADDGTDAQGREVQGAECAPKRVLSGFTRRLRLQDSDALLRRQAH